MLKANWPKRIASTSMPAEKLLEEDGGSLIPPNVKDLPTSFELTRVVDLGAKFKSVNAFVEISEAELIKFYSDVCQNLTKWVAKPPRVRKTQATTSTSEAHSEGEKLVASLLGGVEDKRQETAAAISVSGFAPNSFLNW